MKSTKKTISILLVLLMLFQSCTVYKSTPVSLDQAVEANTKSKVFFKDNEKKIYNKITKEDDEYYGWYKKSIKFPIDANMVNYVRTNNKTGSAIATGGAVLGGAAVVAMAVLTIVVIVGIVSLLDK